MSAPVKNIGNAQINFGTFECGSVFGTLEQASLERTMEELGVPDDFGGFQAYLLANPGYTFQFTAIFRSGGGLPQDGEPIAFPNGVTGNMTTWTKNWESKGQVKMTGTAKYWESIGSNPTVGTLTAE